MIMAVEDHHTLTAPGGRTNLHQGVMIMPGGDHHTLTQV
jgi:hypothetical protein